MPAENNSLLNERHDTVILSGDTKGVEMLRAGQSVRVLQKNAVVSLWLITNKSRPVTSLGLAAAEPE